MSDQDPFDNKPTESNTGEGEPSTPPTDPFADKLKEIKGDDGSPKYATVEDALAALKHSQEFIETLKTERAQDRESMAKLQEEMAKVKTLEEFQASLQTPNTQEPSKTPEGDGEGEKVDLDKLLEDKLNARTKADREKANLEKVVSDLTSQFGDKTSEHIEQVAKRLGTTPSALKDIAKTNPTMAMTLLGSNSSDVQSPNTPKSYPPRTIEETNVAPKYERSAARGGLSNKQLADRWKEVGEYTRKRIGVE